jgi:hypothetical protein
MKALRGHLPWTNVDRRLQSTREIWIATSSPCYGDGTDPIIIKGRAERVTDSAGLERVDRAYAEKYVAPTTGERATIFVSDDHVYRVRPRLVSAWSYANASTRTDWRAE